MCNDFMTMVNESLVRSQFPNGVTHGLIALLFTDGDKLKLPNW